MPAFSSTQLAVAAAAGSPLPSAQFDTDRAWHEYQQQWLFSFQPELCLPSPANPERRNVWKAARRQYQKMAKQLQAASPSFANNATVATATADTATMTFGGIEWHGADLDDLGCPNRAQISDLYEQQRRRWRRMLPVAQEKERDREKKRKRGRGDKNPRRHEGARPLFG